MKKPLHSILIQQLATLENELGKTIEKHGMPTDYHHGLGLMAEEVRELETEVYKKESSHNPLRIQSEAIQVAGLAIKVAMLAAIRAKEATEK